MSILVVDTVSVKGAPSEFCWRLVHDGAKIIIHFESDGLTRTVSNLFCATTDKEIHDEINRLKLINTPTKEILI